MNNIEEQLWNYIDGLCSAEEQIAISHLIETDKSWQLKYEELLQLNSEFSAMELDEPSMAFTYNVMEAIRVDTALKPLKSAIDKRIIWGIGAFFIVTIVALLILVVSGINWDAGNSAQITLPVKLEMPHMASYFNGQLVTGFICFDIVLSLFLVDSYLRKKLNSKQA